MYLHFYTVRHLFSVQQMTCRDFLTEYSRLLQAGGCSTMTVWSTTMSLVTEEQGNDFITHLLLEY